MAEGVEFCALMWHTARDRSRRQAKHLLRRLGVGSTAADLDAALAAIPEHPEFVEILKEANRLAGEAEAAARRIPRRLDEPPDWLVASHIEEDSQYVVYVGSDWPFVAEVFDIEADRIDLHDGHGDGGELDDGGHLGNVRWLRGRPPPERRAELFREARDRLRVYDTRMEIEVAEEDDS